MLMTYAAIVDKLVGHQFFNDVITCNDFAYQIQMRVVILVVSISTGECSMTLHDDPQVITDRIQIETSPCF